MVDSEFIHEAIDLVDELEKSCQSPESFHSETLNILFRGFHTLKGTAGFYQLISLQKACHDAENLLASIRFQPEAIHLNTYDLIRDVLSFIHHSLLALLEGKAENIWYGFDHQHNIYQENHKKPLSVNNNHVTSLISKVIKQPKDSMVRISVLQLDDMLRTLGELIQTKSHLLNIKNDLPKEWSIHPSFLKLEENIIHLDKQIQHMQQSILSVRLLSLHRLFSSFPKMVKDLSEQLGKNIKIYLKGADLEVDRNIIDSITDPLIHLIRNAIDHAIEQPEERLTYHKPEFGQIWVSAEHAGEHIILEVRDDGKGIDAELIGKAAIKKKLIDDETVCHLDHRQLLELIFLPGLSTNDEANNISGRGVGMDIVRANMQKLNAQINIESSLGVGTCFRMMIPLSLSVLPCLVFSDSGFTFSLPLSVIQEVIKIDHQSDYLEPSIIEVHDVQWHYVPFFLLMDQEYYEAKSMTLKFILLVQWVEQRCALGIGEMVGRMDGVARSLNYLKHFGVNSGVVTEHGEIIPILDLESLFIKLRSYQ